MTAKLTFNPDLPTPRLVSEVIIDLLEECGYTLEKQEIYLVVYRRGDQRVTFDAAGRLICEHYFPEEDDRNGGWSIMFSGTVSFAMLDFNKVLLLQSLNIIDFTQLPQFKETFKAMAPAGRNTMVVSKEVPARG